MTSIVIPDSVTSICNVAFGRSGLTSITLSNNLKLIGEGAFHSTGLTSIVIRVTEFLSDVTI
jgi:hypothetical protein